MGSLTKNKQQFSSCHLKFCFKNANKIKGIPPIYNDPRYSSVNHRLTLNNSENGHSPSQLYQTHNELIYDSRYSAIHAIDQYDSRYLQQQQLQLGSDPYNDNGNYGTFIPTNGVYPQQQRVIISRQQLPSQGYLRTRSPSIDSRNIGK